MGTGCCSSSKKKDIETFKKERAEVFADRDTAPTPTTPATAGVISLDDDEDRLIELYAALEDQFKYYLDKEFQFPTNRADLIEAPEAPILKFEIFYEFYRSAMIWNKILIL